MTYFATLFFQTTCDTLIAKDGNSGVERLEPAGSARKFAQRGLLAESVFCAGHQPNEMVWE